MLNLYIYREVEIMNSITMFNHIYQKLEMTDIEVENKTGSTK